MLTRLSPETTGCILRNTTATVAVILLVYLNLFQGIGTNSIRNWDEARHGVNALEMIRSGNYLVHTYEGETDYWNLKPPLSFVTMIAGFKIFGANVLGLRFFSALCSLLSCITLVALCRKLRGADYGLCALLTLLTCDWYFSHHNAITGDPDAMYILIYTFSIAVILGWSKYYIASFCASMAFLTKSFHVFPLCITICILLFIEHKITKNYLRRYFICIIIFLTPILLWVILRMRYDGVMFFNEMFFRDVVARVVSPVEGHYGAPYYQFYYLVKILENYAPWIVLAILALIAARFRQRTAPLETKTLHEDRLPLKLAIIIAVPFCFFSVAASKLPWYVWCAYPFAAMLLVLPVTFALRLRHGKRRTLLLFLVGCTALVAELRAYDTKTRLEQKFHDPAQILLLRASEGGKGVRAYAQNGSWEPRHVLTSTMLGNIQLMPGGEDAFRRDDSPEKVLISLRPVN